MMLANKSDMEILAIADPIMDNLMEGSTEIDHEKHTRDFTDRMKRIVTKEFLKRSAGNTRLNEGSLPEESLSQSSGDRRRSRLYGSSGLRRRQENMWPNWFWWTMSPGTWSITPWYFDRSLAMTDCRPLKSVDDCGRSE